MSSGSSCNINSSLGLHILDLPAPTIAWANFLKQISLYMHTHPIASVLRSTLTNTILYPKRYLITHTYVCPQAGSPGLVWHFQNHEGPGLHPSRYSQSLVCYLIVQTGFLSSRYHASFPAIRRDKETQRAHHLRLGTLSGS